MQGPHTPSPPAREITSRGLFLRRRELLRAAGAALAVTALPQMACGSDAPPPGAAFAGLRPGPFSTDEERTRFEDATRYNNFYELGSEKGDPARNAAQLRTQPWSVAIEGEVAKPGVVPLETLLAPHPLEERVYRLRCVEAWSMVIPWVGFPLRDLLARFEPSSRAKYVAFESILDREHLPGQRRDILEWPYAEGLRMDEAMHPLAILAV